MLQVINPTNFTVNNPPLEIKAKVSSLSEITTEMLNHTGTLFLELETFDNKRILEFKGELILQVNKGKGAFTNHHKGSLTAQKIAIKCGEFLNEGALKAQAGELRIDSADQKCIKGHLETKGTLILASEKKLLIQETKIITPKIEIISPSVSVHAINIQSGLLIVSQGIVKIQHVVQSSLKGKQSSPLIIDAKDGLKILNSSFDHNEEIIFQSKRYIYTNHVTAKTPLHMTVKAKKMENFNSNFIGKLFISCLARKIKYSQSSLQSDQDVVIKSRHLITDELTIDSGKYYRVDVSHEARMVGGKLFAALKGMFRSRQDSIQLIGVLLEAEKVSGVAQDIFRLFDCKIKVQERLCIQADIVNMDKTNTLSKRAKLVLKGRKLDMNECRLTGNHILEAFHRINHSNTETIATEQLYRTAQFIHMHNAYEEAPRLVELAQKINEVGYRMVSSGLVFKKCEAYHGQFTKLQSKLVVWRTSDFIVDHMEWEADEWRLFANQVRLVFSTCLNGQGYLEGNEIDLTATRFMGSLAIKNGIRELRLTGIDVDGELVIANQGPMTAPHLSAKGNKCLISGKGSAWLPFMTANTTQAVSIQLFHTLFLQKAYLQSHTGAIQVVAQRLLVDGLLLRSAAEGHLYAHDLMVVNQSNLNAIGNLTLESDYIMNCLANVRAKSLHQKANKGISSNAADIEVNNAIEMICSYGDVLLKQAVLNDSELYIEAGNGDLSNARIRSSQSSTFKIDKALKAYQSTLQSLSVIIMHAGTIDSSESNLQTVQLEQIADYGINNNQSAINAGKMLQSSPEGIVSLYRSALHIQELFVQCSDLRSSQMDLHAKGSVRLNTKNAMDLSHAIIRGTNKVIMEGNSIFESLTTIQAQSIRQSASHGIQGSKAKLIAEANLNIQSAFEPLILDQSHLEGKNISLEGKALFAPEAHIKSKLAGRITVDSYLILNRSDIRSRHLHLAGNSISAASANMIGKSFESHADFTYAPKLKANYSDLMMVDSHYGNLILEDAIIHTTDFALQAGKAGANGLHVYAKEADFKTRELLTLDRALLRQAGKTTMIAGSLSMRSANMTMDSLKQQVEGDIVASFSHVLAKRYIHQVALNGGIDLEGAIAIADAMIERIAHRDISHKSACSTSKELYVQTEGKLDNREGSFIINEGLLSIVANEIATNKGSHIGGFGNVSIESKKAYTEKSTLDFFGTYKVKAKAITLDSHLNLAEVQLEAFGGDIQLLKKILAMKIIGIAKGTFYNRMDIRGWQLKLEIKAHHLDNQGLIVTDEAYIQQDEFHHPKQIEAKALLELSSLSAMQLNQPLSMEGTLRLISLARKVEVNAPITTEGDLTIYGRDIDLSAFLEVKGRGIVHTKGLLNVDHTSAYFGKGIDVKAHQIFAKASTLHIQSTDCSRIECHQFFLLSDYFKITKEKTFFGFTIKEDAYVQTPSCFEHVGSIHANVKNRFWNQGSSVVIDGDMLLEGHDCDNQNDMHLHQWKEYRGKESKRCLGIKYGSTNKYAHLSKWIVDGLAYFRVNGMLTTNLTGAIKVNGVLSAQDVQGTAHDLYVGLFQPNGRSPNQLPPTIHLEKTEDYQPEGHFQVDHNMHLEIENETHNNAFITAGNELYLKTEKYHSHARVTEEREDVIRVKSFGRHKKNAAVCDHLNPGAQLNAKVIQLILGSGINKGGKIDANDLLYIKGRHFENSAATQRTIVHSKIKNSSALKSFNAWDTATQFTPGKVHSDGFLKLEIEDELTNRGAEIIGFDDTEITAGNYQQEPLFNDYGTSKHGWFYDIKRRVIVMQNSMALSIAGNFLLHTTKSDARIGGDVGSLRGKATIQASRDILFNAFTHYAINEESRFSLSPTSIKYSENEYSSSQSVLPHFISGQDARIAAVKRIVAQGVSFEVLGNLHREADEMVFKEHIVRHRQEMNGVGFSVEFFGSKLIEAIAAQQSATQCALALLSEHPAINSIMHSAAAKKGNRVIPIIKSIVEVWKNAAESARAFNQGNLKGSLFHQLGIADTNGKFSPKFTFHFGGFDAGSQVAESHMCTSYVQGDLTSLGKVQHYQIQEKVGGNATFQAKKVHWEHGTSQIENSSGSEGINLVPRASFGAQFSMSEGDQTVPHNSTLEVVGYLKIEADDIEGIGFNAVAGYLAAKIAHRVHLIGSKSSQSHRSIAASFSTNGTMNAVIDRGTKETLHPSSIRAIHGGTLDADEVVTKGSSIDNIAVKAQRRWDEKMEMIHSGMQVEMQFDWHRDKNRAIAIPFSINVAFKDDGKVSGICFATFNIHPTQLKEDLYEMTHLQAPRPTSQALIQEKNPEVKEFSEMAVSKNKPMKTKNQTSSKKTIKAKTFVNHVDKKTLNKEFTEVPIEESEHITNSFALAIIDAENTYVKVELMKQMQLAKALASGLHLFEDTIKKGTAYVENLIDMGSEKLCAISPAVDRSCQMIKRWFNSDHHEDAHDLAHLGPEILEAASDLVHLDTEMAMKKAKLYQDLYQIPYGQTMEYYKNIEYSASQGAHHVTEATLLYFGGKALKYGKNLVIKSGHKMGHKLKSLFNPIIEKQYHAGISKGKAIKKYTKDLWVKGKEKGKHWLHHSAEKGNRAFKKANEKIDTKFPKVKSLKTRFKPHVEKGTKAISHHKGKVVDQLKKGIYKGSTIYAKSKIVAKPLLEKGGKATRTTIKASFHGGKKLAKAGVAVGGTLAKVTFLNGGVDHLLHHTIEFNLHHKIIHAIVDPVHTFRNFANAMEKLKPILKKVAPFAPLLLLNGSSPENSNHSAFFSEY